MARSDGTAVGLSAKSVPTSSGEELVSTIEALGTLLRDTHRSYARVLGARIAGEGVSLGMWYFLRVLWETDGLSQRELSRRIGTMEPTTVAALAQMEQRGIVRRITDPADRRRRIVFLTDYGRSLKNLALPAADQVDRLAAAGVTANELDRLIGTLTRVKANLDRAQVGGEGAPAASPEPRKLRA